GTAQHLQVPRVLQESPAATGTTGPPGDSAQPQVPQVLQGTAQPLQVPQVFGREHLGELVVKQIPAQVALVMPHGLNPIGQVDPHLMVTGQGQSVNLHHQYPKKVPHVVNVALIPWGCGPGNMAGTRSWSPCRLPSRNWDTGCQRGGDRISTPMWSQNFRSMPAHQVVHLMEEVLLAEAADHHHVLHGHNLPVWGITDLEDHHPPALLGWGGHKGQAASWSVKM
ncbi:unnamed protein product, partial [Gulo gulo]